MAIEITVPRLGWSMEEGMFSGWLKRPGDWVASGDALFAVESDKVTMDIESLDSGFLHLPPGAPEAGSPVTVGQCIGYLLAEGEAAPVAVKPTGEETPTPPPAAAADRSASPDLQPAPPSNSGAGKIPVTPRARRVAAELGINASALTGTGSGGRIRECDVRQASSASPAAAAAVRPIPVTSLRRAIAERMMHSRENTAPVTLTSRADASRIVALRNNWKTAAAGDIDAPVPSVTDIIAKLTSIALEAHPLLAGRWTKDWIVLPEAIHIGIAVDTRHGLLAPVIRNVPSLRVREIAHRSRELIEAARARRLQPEDLQGGVFTITNLGNYGIDAFTPIIHFPETAVLGVGAIRLEPVALDNGQLAAREQVWLSLTFDHRVVDGGPAARFLQTIRQLIECPPDDAME